MGWTRWCDLANFGLSDRAGFDHFDRRDGRARDGGEATEVSDALVEECDRCLFAIFCDFRTGENAGKSIITSRRLDAA